MKPLENEILKFIEPVFRFCLKRVSNRHDAEDLASEIILHVLDGAGKYEIQSFDAWVWRIAHNRYARYCEAKHVRAEFYSEDALFDLADDYDFVDRLTVTDEYETVFRYLHTLSSQYKNLLVDYYIGELPIRDLSKKYSLPETTIKWRLNISRRKIKKRIGDHKMDKIYKHINWQTTTCNGALNTGAYLSGQVARAICETAYEKPLTIEEISLKTGLPTMYIEDALPHLLYGDAIEQIGSKYAANFIILRLKDKEQMEKQFAPLISDIADYFEKQFTERSRKVTAMHFYGHHFGMARLGYIALPLVLRAAIRNIMDELPGLAQGPYPPRKDGGYGWFLIEEAKDENDQGGEYNSGCNSTDEESSIIYYYHIFKYFCSSIYHNGGTRWLSANRIPQKSTNGIIPEGSLSEDDIVRLLQRNLIRKDTTGYQLNFACFTQDQFSEFSGLFRLEDKRIEKLLTNLILNIREYFQSFVPKRLERQINQWVSCFVHSITGYVTEELIARGILEKPDREKPLTNGVFYVEGPCINP
ncbi:RNA polymerase sigma factor (sigma-70 family) [Anaerotaenia torta]|uniref:RNA polymerase sigma factor n=1 Tax=Anaerotaenia torta TaxID=433293 RepID=UPI003D260240